MIFCAKSNKKPLPEELITAFVACRDSLARLQGWEVCTAYVLSKIWQIVRIKASHFSDNATKVRNLFETAKLIR